MVVNSYIVYMIGRSYKVQIKINPKEYKLRTWITKIVSVCVCYMKKTVI